MRRRTLSIFSVLLLFVAFGVEDAARHAVFAQTAGATDVAAETPPAKAKTTHDGNKPATGEPAKSDKSNVANIAPDEATKPGQTVGKNAKKKQLQPAKKLFGAKRQPAALAPQAIGYYSRGCLAGAKQVPETGPAWQAMRLSRNRNWGHPVLVDLLLRMAVEAKEAGEFPGLLIGDIAQPRGGPMLTGHASHQVGLDADVWLRTPPKKNMSRKKRETFQPISMLAKNWLDVNLDAFTFQQVALIRRAASYPEVARVGVNPAIKVALCRAVGGDKPWLKKVQGWKGHHYHMHIRIKCPPGSTKCRDQSRPRGTGCAAAEKWYADTKAWLERPKKKKKKKVAKKKKAKKKKTKRKPKPAITMAGLPDSCRYVLEADNRKLELLPVNPLQALRSTMYN